MQKIDIVHKWRLDMTLFPDQGLSVTDLGVSYGLSHSGGKQNNNIQVAFRVRLLSLLLSII